METETEEKVESKELTKEEKLDREKAKILSSVADAKLDTLTTKVAWLLNHFSETRDSDITLMLKYWGTFEQSIYNGGLIDPKDLYELTRLTSISRSRATIQNTHKLFLASEEVRKHRGTLEEEEKEKQRESYSLHPSFTVYMDESGKTSDNLVVGSLWLLNGIEALPLYHSIKKWREEQKFNQEIHFAKISNSNVKYYYGIIDILYEKSAALSFKALTLKRKGLRNPESALEDMFYHMLVRGVEHENNSSRAPLPRKLQVWKDAEQESQDNLFIANIRDKLNNVAATTFLNQLLITDIFAIDSKTTELMQLADLFTASVNRLINFPGQKNVKDDFAKAFLKKFGLKGSKIKDDLYGDMIVVKDV